MRDALRRMYEATPEHPDGENIFYYLTVYNEPYPQPAGAFRTSLAGPPGSRRASCAGFTGTRPRREPADGPGPRAQILASGVALRQALAAQEMLAADWGVSADVWSATSWTELRREALACESWNMLHPGEPSAGAVCDVSAC